MDTAEAIDYDAALATALRLAPPGPQLRRDEIAQTVGELRAVAARASGHVAELTGLHIPPGDPPLVVVDRAKWLRINLTTMPRLLGDRGKSGGIMARVAAAEVGAMLAWMSTRVLGQFDPFGEPRRLMLVAPNVVSIERALDVEPSDFRLWVSLHEETHRVQFGNAPWLADHLRSQLLDFIAGVEIDASALPRIVARLRESEGTAAGSLLDLVTDDKQAERLEQIIAIMSLIEGHADLIMDEVGPSVVPSVAQIRAKFDQRRTAGGLTGLVRRLFGMEAKMRQYAEGAAFCRAVTAEIGMTGLNQVWTSARALPNPAEIADPQLWLARMSDRPLGTV